MSYEAALPVVPPDGWHEVFDAMPAQVAVIDPSGRVLAVNRAWTLFGLAQGADPKSTGVGADYLSVCDRGGSGVAADVAAGLRDVLSGARSLFEIDDPCHSSQDERWLHVLVAPALVDGRHCAVATHVNITERVRSDAGGQRMVIELRELSAQLDRERQRLVMAQSVAKIGSWETDLGSLEVIWSDETYRIFGVSADSYIPNHESFLSFVHPDDRALVDAAFRESFNTREVRTVEHRVLGADGAIRLCEERWQTLVDADGAPMRAVGTCQDITERKRLETQHLRTQRLESLGTLAGGIAHDLNNVLTPILASIELLRIDDTPEGREESLATIEASALRGADMVRQVLTFARGSEGSNVPVDVPAVVHDVQKILRETFPKDIRIHVTEPADAWRFRGDPTQLHQVLMNLCLNARDAMPRGGTLSISLENELIDDVYAGMNPPAHPGAYVRIEVADTGTGIPPEVQERMFEPFFTTKELGKGTGLGLSTVHTIVRSHGGFVNLYSEVGKGSRFTVHLPAIDLPTTAAAQASLPNGLPRGNGELILVVDDEEGIRHIVKRTLERYGYRVTTAMHGAEGVAAYVAANGQVAAVLTDMAMPVLDGPSMIRALRAIKPEVRIIGSSGLTAHEGVLAAVDSGVNRWVPKPYTAEALLGALAAVLRVPGASD